MKNVFLLPTNKPSRLRFGENNKLWFILFSQYIAEQGKQYIYITSLENIKHGDWCIDEKENIVKADKNFIFNCSNEFNEYWKKIILTTDLDLIADGVEKIDDTFIEWFLKNQNCEFVKIFNSKWVLGGEIKDFYKIIITKEEAKKDLKVGNNTNFGIITDVKEHSVCFGKNKAGVDIWYKKSDVKLKPKQETLEEAAERYADTDKVNHNYKDTPFTSHKEAFKDGADRKSVV